MARVTSFACGTALALGDFLCLPLHFGKRSWCLIEAIRSAVQTGLYVCDYTTKPNMTCAPLLTHLRDGMQHLSDEIEGEDQRKRFQDYIRKGLIATSSGDAAQRLLADGPSRKRAPRYSKDVQSISCISLISEFVSPHLLLVFVPTSILLRVYTSGSDTILSKGAREQIIVVYGVQP